MDLSIIIPCYNEVESMDKLHGELSPVVAELLKRMSVELVFVDDGSSDGTLDALRARFTPGNNPGAALCFEQHPRNLGLGAAVRTGMAASSAKIIVTTDSDGTYKFSSIPLLLEYLRPGVGIVTASPYDPQGSVVGVPGYRLFLSKGSSLLYRILLDRHVHTYTCLFRAYRREVIENVTFQSNGFLAGTELMVKAMLKGYKVVEFPAVLYARVYGVSKAKLMRTIIAHLRFQGQVLLHRLHLVKLN